MNMRRGQGSKRWWEELGTLRSGALRSETQELIIAEAANKLLEAGWHKTLVQRPELLKKEDASVEAFHEAARGAGAALIDSADDESIIGFVTIAWKRGEPTPFVAEVSHNLRELDKKEILETLEELTKQLRYLTQYGG